ncbi:MAG: hypothetical protein P4L46_17345 [Fimbriimonas sp.]|nr:hypothetical protein [Fimbriimonas sp.]
MNRNRLIGWTWLLLIGIAILGCNSAGEPPQSIATPQEVNNVVEMRKIFDSSHGSWDAVSSADKERYNKLAGDPKKGSFMWDRMLHPGPQMGGQK